MKKFNFRLEPVLKLRKQIENQKKRVVGDMMAEINQQQQRALELADSIRDEGQRVKNLQEQGQVDLEWMSYYYRYVAQTRQAIQLRINNVMNMQQNLNTARQDLSQAARQTKALEKLKEKRKNAYMHEFEHQQRREWDEIGSNLYLRKMNHKKEDN